MREGDAVARGRLTWHTKQTVSITAINRLKAVWRRRSLASRWLSMVPMGTGGLGILGGPATSRRVQEEIAGQYETRLQ